jgi:hypothetical protein
MLHFFLRRFLLWHLVLNVAEGEPWTDGGWTTIGSKIEETRHDNMATRERPVGINGYDDNNVKNEMLEADVMKTIHCKCDGDGKHGCVWDCKQWNGNQRLNWDIKHID